MCFSFVLAKLGIHNMALNTLFLDQSSFICSRNFAAYAQGQYKYFHRFRTRNVEGRWPHGWCAPLRIERSGFKLWPETLCSWARHFTFKVPLSNKAYKLQLASANFMLGVALQWTCIPCRGERKYSWSFYTTKFGITSGFIGFFSFADLTFTRRVGGGVRRVRTNSLWKSIMEDWKHKLLIFSF